MRILGLAALLATAAWALPTGADAGQELRIEFSNPALSPASWTLVLHPDGRGHFHSDAGELTAAKLHAIEPGTVDRDVQLSEPFAGKAFETVHRLHDLSHINCESHLKVAFQGWKKLTYTGPDGAGSCEFNYSKDRDLQALGESFVAVASTIVEGARLELLLHHDPLGLDQEMQFLQEASQDGRIQQVEAIRGILEQVEADTSVMERVRKRARLLLAASSK